MKLDAQKKRIKRLLISMINYNPCVNSHQDIFLFVWSDKNREDDIDKNTDIRNHISGIGNKNKRNQSNKSIHNT